MRRGALATRRDPRGPGAVSLVLAGGVLLAMGLAASWLQACRRPSPEEELRERAQQYLQLKQKREWPAIYEGLLDPETRKTLKIEDFLNRRKGTIELLGFAVVVARVEDDHGTVRARVDTMIPVLSPRGGTTMIRKELDEPQEWVRREGRWYIQLKG